MVNLYTVLITWKWQNNSNTMIQHQPSSFQIECFIFSDRHRTEMSVNSTTFSMELLGLLPSTAYNCCVSAVYGSYTALARGVCIKAATIQPPTSQPIETPMVQPNGCPSVNSGAISTGTSEQPPSETVPGDISTIKVSQVI